MKPTADAASLAPTAAAPDPNAPDETERMLEAMPIEELASIGGTLFGPDEQLKQRLLAIADIKAWKADELARSTPKEPLRCEAMSVPELALAWVEQHSKSDRDRDDNFFTLLNYESNLREEDPD